MEEKLKKIKGGWVQDQINLIKKLNATSESITPYFKDKKDLTQLDDKGNKLFTLLSITNGHKNALVFRLKNAVHLIKELTGETIELPDDVDTLVKAMKETILLNESDEIVDIENNNYTKLLAKLL